MATISTAKAFYFPDDAFKHILSYTESLPKCDMKNCKFVAYEQCDVCADLVCKKCIKDSFNGFNIDHSFNGICKKCVEDGYANCEICYRELTNMECDRCYSKYCVECVKRDDDGLLYDDRCIECGDSSDEE